MRPQVAGGAAGGGGVADQPDSFGVKLDAVSAQARSRDRRVMKMPRSRNALGLSRSASARKIAGTAGNQASARRRGLSAHAGGGQPSRSAKWSARAAKAASSRAEPVGAGSSLPRVPPH
jgi:hypothetical protein